MSTRTREGGLFGKRWAGINKRGKGSKICEIVRESLFDDFIICFCFGELRHIKHKEIGSKSFFKAESIVCQIGQ